MAFFGVVSVIDEGRATVSVPCFFLVMPLPAAVSAKLSLPISTGRWLELLSPAKVAEYIFNGYNCILSNLAMDVLTEEDFTPAGAPEVPTIQNLRTALAELYPGSTCELKRDRNRFTLALTVPGGEADTWPAQIPQPGPITYPNRGRVTHG